MEISQAIDIWEPAINTHRANHPNTQHDLADLSAVAPDRYTRTDLAWFSPPCTNHSKASGKAEYKPHVHLEHVPAWEDLRAMEEDDSRASMFEVIRYSAHHKYEGVMVENVPEILMWSMYPMWVRAMQALGYSYNYLLANSAHTNHHGPATPQNRLRYYGMFWLGDKDIHWPQFHGPSPRAWDYLDNNPGPLLEDRAVPLASTTLRRIENTLAKHRLDPRVFVKYYGSSEVGARITEPFPTITTRDHLAIATRMSDGTHYRLLSLGEKARAGGFGDSYIWPESVADATKLIGNAVSPSAARDIAWPMVQSMEHTLR